MTGLRFDYSTMVNCDTWLMNGENVAVRPNRSVAVTVYAMVPIGASAGTFHAPVHISEGCREYSEAGKFPLAAPPHGHVDRIAANGQMGRQDGRVLGFARAAVDRRHPDADALTTLEAIGENAMGRRGRGLIEVREISPDDKLARRVAGLRRWRRQWCATSASRCRRGGRGLILPGNRQIDGNRHQRRERQHRYGLEKDRHCDAILPDLARLFQHGAGPVSLPAPPGRHMAMEEVPD